MKIELSVWEFLMILGGGVLIPSPIAKLLIRKKGEMNMSNVKESKELIEAIVAVAHAIEAAKKDGFSLVADLGQLVIAVPAIAAGLQGMGLISDEIKALDEAGIEELVGEAVLVFGDSSEKSKLYVKEGLNILLSVFKIMKA